MTQSDTPSGVTGGDSPGRVRFHDRQVLRLEDFTDDDLAAIENAEAPPATDAFDNEVN